MQGGTTSAAFEVGGNSSEPVKKLSALMQFALIVGPFMAMIDSSVVNVAIPVISKSFSAPISTVQWVSSAYFLSMGAFLVFSPYASKRFGPILPYSISLGGFTFFSLMSALSPSLDILIVARIAQGAFGSLMVPLAMDLLFGASKGRERISPLIGIVLFLAPALGPTLGGGLIQYFGWPSVFLINVPIGIAGTSIAIRGRGIAQPSFIKRHRFDFIGSAIFGSGIGLLLYGSSQMISIGLRSDSTKIPIVAGLVLMLVYGLWTRGRESPSVNLKVVQDLKSAISLTISILANIVLFSALFLIPVFVELVKGSSALTAGLILLPQGITTGMGTILGEYWSKRVDNRMIVVAGMAILTISTLPLVFISSQSSNILLSLILCGRGVALGLTIQPLLYQILGRLEPLDIPDGSTLFNVAERIGGAFGISVLASLFESQEIYYLMNSKASTVAIAGTLAFHDIMLILVAISVVGLILAFSVRRDNNL